MLLYRDRSLQCFSPSARAVATLIVSLRARTICQQGGTPCLCSCGLAATGYIKSSSSIGDSVFTASLLSPLSAKKHIKSPFPLLHPITTVVYFQIISHDMVIMKVPLGRSDALGSVHRTPYADVPSLDVCNLIALREQSRDDPPSPPPQPPPSPANWTRLSELDDVPMASVGTCTTLVLPGTNSSKD